MSLALYGVGGGSIALVTSGAMFELLTRVGAEKVSNERRASVQRTARPLPHVTQTAWRSSRVVWGKLRQEGRNGAVNESI